MATYVTFEAVVVVVVVVAVVAAGHQIGVMTRIIENNSRKKFLIERTDGLALQLQQHKSRVATSRLRIRLQHCVAFFITFLGITSKTQRNAENACGNRMWKLGLNGLNQREILKIEQAVVIYRLENKFSFLFFVNIFKQIKFIQSI